MKRRNLNVRCKAVKDCWVWRLVSWAWVVPRMETGRQWAGRDEQKGESVTTLTSDRPPVNPSTHTWALIGACLHTHVHTLPCTPAHFFVPTHTDPSVGLCLYSKEHTCRARVQPRAGHHHRNQAAQMHRTQTRTFVLLRVLMHTPKSSPHSPVHLLF